jgi:ATP-dependent Zn protease
MKAGLAASDGRRFSRRLEMELSDSRKVEANYPSDLSALEFEKVLGERGIRHESRAGGGGTAWWPMLTYLLPFLLFGAFWIFLMSRVQEKRSDRRRGETEGEARGQAEDSGTDPYSYG